MFKFGILGQLNFLQKLKSLNSPPEKKTEGVRKKVNWKILVGQVDRFWKLILIKESQYSRCKGHKRRRVFRTLSNIYDWTFYKTLTQIWKPPYIFVFV